MWALSCILTSLFHPPFLPLLPLHLSPSLPVSPSRSLSFSLTFSLHNTHTHTHTHTHTILFLIKRESIAVAMSFAPYTISLKGWRNHRTIIKILKSPPPNVSISSADLAQTANCFNNAVYSKERDRAWVALSWLPLWRVLRISLPWDVLRTARLCINCPWWCCLTFPHRELG